MNLLDLMIKIGIDDQASSKIAGVANSVKGGLAGAAKAGAAAMAAVSVAAVGGVAALGKASLEAYSDFEQLNGGVKKLFGEDSAAIVAENAQKAFQTAGMSANEYMETATGMSAALINSLGGDTAAAAGQVDVAMRSMADNVNTFGTDIESVKMAYMGFAKQNYTMLDNLKLGYGGTKSEMERLIADANEYAATQGQAADLTIDSYSDIVTAIELVQQKQGIAGATYAESMTTIEGSVKATKAAWSNLLTEFGKSDGDVGARMTELVNSALAAFNNIIPRVKQIGESIAGALPEILAKAGEAFGELFPIFSEAITGIMGSLGQFLPQAMEFGGQLVGSLLQGVLEVMPSLIEGFTAGIVQLVDSLAANTDSMMDTAGQLFMSIATALAQAIPQILGALLNLLVQLVGYVVTHIPDMLAAGAQLIVALASGFAEMAGEVGGAVGEVVQGGIDEVGNFIGSIFDAGANLIQGLIDGILSGVAGIVSAIGDAVGGAIEEGKKLLGIASPSKVFRQMGRYTVEGYVEGVNDLKDRAAAEVSSMFGAMMGNVGLGYQFGYGLQAPALATAGLGSVVNNYYIDGVQYMPDSRIAEGIRLFVDEIDLEGRA